MKRKIDDLGRLVIPKEMRNELGLLDGDEVNIELSGNTIIITNPNAKNNFINHLYAMINHCENQDVKQCLTKALNIYLEKEEEGK